MSKLGRFGAAHLCELALQDKNNKWSVIGIFSGSVLITEFPTKMKLALFIEYWPKEVGKYDIDLELYLGRKKFAKVVAEAETTRLGTPAILNVNSLEFGLPSRTTLRVTGSVNGQRAETILKKDFALKSDFSDSIG